VEDGVRHATAQVTVMINWKAQDNDRVHDRDLPGALQERQAVAGRTMALRWCAAGMLEADHQLRRVNGRLHLPKLRAALDRYFSRNVSTNMKP
jgi:hypothetical protein